MWLYGTGALASSLSAYTQYPGVSLSPDGKAFTTEAGVRSYERFSAGYTVYTGEKPGREPTVGEHYYTSGYVSSIRIYKWVVTWADAHCIHPYYHITDYHGLSCPDSICYRSYPQGWTAYCADCGERVTASVIYMNSSTARGIRSLPGAADYFYCCPWCGGLEQGIPYSHNCSQISVNGYYVSYQANAPAGTRVSGSMADTGHMYDNASTFEGQDAGEAGFESVSLRLNAYTCPGYEFVEWNTEADGSGLSYEDGADILNLTSVNKGTVTLYARWRREGSRLNVDLAGGTLAGETSLTASGRGGEKYQIATERIVPPQGYVVTFETNGGNEVAAGRTRKRFCGWDTSGVLYGSMSGDTYYFGSTLSVTDDLIALYEDAAYTLPACQKSGYGFAGWYYDGAFESFAGFAGEEIRIGEDTCLYARWLSLSLSGMENYEAFGGIGAVDLVLSEPDELEKWYQIYQSTDGVSWTPLFEELTGLEVHTGQAAVDQAPPKKVTGFTLAVTPEGKMQVAWQAPKDQGTTYYHQAESFRQSGSGYFLLCRSNITENLLVSGVKGYYYYQDGNASGTICGDESYTDRQTALLDIGEEATWLHIAAVDVAGNLGETASIRIPAADDTGPGEDPDPDPDEDDAEIELTLYAWIVHSRAGYEGDFKSGEGGVLHILAGGYAQRIEVVFPAEFTAIFPELNAVFFYDEPRLIQKESLEFSVPLYMTPGVYEVTVRAYRDDLEAEEIPALVVVEESVLDELRTRIRNNL